MAEQCPNKWSDADEKVDAIAYPYANKASMTIQEVKGMEMWDIIDHVEEEDIEVNDSIITDKFGVRSFIIKKFRHYGYYGDVVMCVVGSYEVAKAVAETDPSESAGVVQYASNGFAIVV